jgi:methionyl-tRNA formyltransferase
MRLVFMGTPQFAVPTLAALHDRGHEIAAVFTQPDKPAGRGRTMRASAVKQLALARGLVVEQPEKLRESAVVDRMRELAPNAIVVAAYGKILPKSLLDIPPRGAINVHGSLLPKYRGAAPIQRAILAGETTTGVTIMQMNEKMDAGDILLQEATEIRADDTSASLAERLAEIGARLLVEALERLERGSLTARAQDESLVTFAPLVDKREGAIRWTSDAAAIERAVRAFTPWPSAFTTLRGKTLKIHRARVIAQEVSASAGTVVRAAGDELDVATGKDALRIVEAQLEGKRPVAARDLVAGRIVTVGDRLGSVAG